jgi:hypothetical protein
MSKLMAWWVCVVLLATSGCGGTQDPPELVRVRQAAGNVGLVREQGFVDTIPFDRDSPGARAQLDSGFFGLPSGAARVVLSADRVVVASDSSTSFSVAAYVDRDRLALVHIFAPLVNGSERQNEQMLATVDSVAAVLAGDTTGLASWVDTSWQAVWRDWEHSRAAADRIKEKRFGPYRMAISGVPPDFVFFGALRVD